MNEMNIASNTRICIACCGTWTEVEALKAFGMRHSPNFIWRQLFPRRFVGKVPQGLTMDLDDWGRRLQEMEECRLFFDAGCLHWVRQSAELQRWVGWREQSEPVPPWFDELVSGSGVELKDAKMEVRHQPIVLRHDRRNRRLLSSSEDRLPDTINAVQYSIQGQLQWWRIACA